MSSSSSGAPASNFKCLNPRQRLVDQLINSISQPQDIDQIKEFLEEVEIEDIDELHSITRLSALETLCSLYPLLKEIHLEILDLLLEKGARLDKVEEGILRRMMDMELETRTSIVKEFEDKLIQKFNEIDEEKYITLNEIDANQAQNNKRSSSLTPLTESSPSPSPSHRPKVSTDTANPPSLQSPRLTPNPLPLPTNRSPLASTPLINDRSPAPATSRREHSSSSSHRPANVAASSPPLLPPRPSIPLRPPPTQVQRPRSPPQYIRLHTALPLYTSFISLATYFSHVLHVSISSVSLFVDRPPAHAFFDIDKKDWDSDYLNKRIHQTEDAEPFRDAYGRTWRLKPAIARITQLRQCEGDVGTSFGEHGWIGVTLRGFDRDTKKFHVEDFLSKFLKFWKDFEMVDTAQQNTNTKGLTRGEPRVEVKFKIREQAFKLVEREFGRFMFNGKWISVFRDVETTRDTDDRSEHGKLVETRAESNHRAGRGREMKREDGGNDRGFNRGEDIRRHREREDSEVRTRRSRSRDRDSHGRKRRRSRSRSKSRSRSRSRRHRNGSYDRRRSKRRHRREEEEEEEEDYSRHGKSERRRSRSPDRSRHRHRRSHRSPSPIKYDNDRGRSRSPSYDRSSSRRRSFSNKNSQNLYPPPLPERYSPSSFDYSRQSHFDSFNSSNSRHLPPSNETSLSNYLENRFASTPIYSSRHPPADPSRTSSNLPPTFAPFDTPPPSLLQRIEPQLFKPVPTRPWQVATLESPVPQQHQATSANTQGLGVGSGTGKWSSNAWEQVDRDKIEREKKEREREWQYWEERSKGTIDGNGKGRYERRYW